jgi:hypothetical protein
MPPASLVRRMAPGCKIRSVEAQRFLLRCSRLRPMWEAVPSGEVTNADAQSGMHGHACCGCGHRASARPAGVIPASASAARVAPASRQGRLGLAAWVRRRHSPRWGRRPRRPQCPGRFVPWLGSRRAGKPVSALPSPRDGQHRRCPLARALAGGRHSTAELQSGKPGPTAGPRGPRDAPPAAAEEPRSLQELALQTSPGERLHLRVQHALQRLPGSLDQATCRGAAGPTGWSLACTSRG